MGFTIDKVHEFARSEANGRMILTKRNPYVRLVKEGETPINIQSGRLYSDSGQAIKVEDLPNWARKQILGLPLKTMKEVGLGDGLGVSVESEEEIQKSDKPLGPMDIVQAVNALDPENKDHWTSEGKPSLDEVSRLTGKYVSRQKIEEETKGYRRPNLE